MENKNVDEKITISISVEVQVLATLAHLLEKNGYYPGSRGMVLSSVLNSKYDEILEVYGRTFQNDYEALEYLEQTRLIGRAKRNQAAVFRIRSKHNQNVAFEEQKQVDVYLGNKPKQDFDQSESYRQVVKSMIELGQEPTKKMLKLAQMDIQESDDSNECFDSDENSGDIAGMFPNE